MSDDVVFLTAEMRQRILASIRAGCYAHIAAQAWGVPAAVWQRWLSQGQEPDALEPYRSLNHAVEEAKAQARLKAEVEAQAKDPRFWLKNGPGKDPGDAPGWGPVPRTSPATELGIPLGELQWLFDRLRPLMADHADVIEQLAHEAKLTGAGKRAA